MDRFDEWCGVEAERLRTVLRKFQDGRIYFTKGYGANKQNVTRAFTDRLAAKLARLEELLSERP